MIYGFKKMQAKHIGYKNVFCAHCNLPRLANHYSQKNMLTLFWMPVIPLATSKHWQCSACQRDPSSKGVTSKLNKLMLTLTGAITFLFALTALLTFFAPAGSAMYHQSAHQRPLLYLAISAALIGCYLFFKPRKSIPLVGDPNQIIAVDQINCLYCQTPLEIRPTLHCPKCELDVHID